MRKCKTRHKSTDKPSAKGLDRKAMQAAGRALEDLHISAASLCSIAWEPAHLCSISCGSCIEHEHTRVYCVMCTAMAVQRTRTMRTSLPLRSAPDEGPGPAIPGSIPLALSSSCMMSFTSCSSVDSRFCASFHLPSVNASLTLRVRLRLRQVLEMDSYEGLSAACRAHVLRVRPWCLRAWSMLTPFTA